MATTTSVLVPLVSCFELCERLRLLLNHNAIIGGAIARLVRPVPGMHVMHAPYETLAQWVGGTKTGSREELDWFFANLRYVPLEVLQRFPELLALGQKEGFTTRLESTGVTKVSICVLVDDMAGQCTSMNAIVLTSRFCDEELYDPRESLVIGLMGNLEACYKVIQEDGGPRKRRKRNQSSPPSTHSGAGR